ncbi:MAG TPA: hypothetical protein VNT25_03270 [Allosphingosinicella sp.]|nr:hypothetical protein [Allosphingosinicella sp.]
MALRTSTATALLLCALLAGCASTATEAPQVPVQPRPVQSAVGIEGVIGRNAATLTSRFGAPDLDIREGSARKLQFSGAVCVLDAYLYPRSGGGEPVVTHVDARLPDGRDTDRAACIAALSRR